jgi:hypothetical protein
MPAGKRERTPWKSWLTTTLGMAAIAGIICFAISAALSSVFPAEVRFSLNTWFVVPVVLVTMAVRREGNAFRYCPKRESGTVSQVVIRNRYDGRPIATARGTTLVDASFVGVSLYSACLWAEDLSNAKFRGVDLRNAMLRAAILDGADLRGANLRGADLAEARIHDADLRGADLTEAFIRTADLTGALYDQHTRWPKGFAPTKHGCILVDGPPGLPIPASVGAPGETALPIPSQIPSTESPTLPRTSARASSEEAAVEARA